MNKEKFLEEILSLTSYQRQILSFIENWLGIKFKGDFSKFLKQNLEKAKNKSGWNIALTQKKLPEDFLKPKNKNFNKILFLLDLDSVSFTQYEFKYLSEILSNKNNFDLGIFTSKESEIFDKVLFKTKNKNKMKFIVKNSKVWIDKYDSIVYFKENKETVEIKDFLIELIKK